MLNIRNWEWSRYKENKRKKLKNDNFTIIASNCCGTMIYYDLNLPYLTPTINLSLDMNDFVKMVENLKWYMNQKLIEVERADDLCPIGLLGDVKIKFVHYDTFDEGAAKWEERKNRINWDNLFIMGTERDGCTYETIERFDRLEYKNKVIYNVPYKVDTAS